MINVVNTFVDTSDLVYTITSTNSGGTKSQSEVPLDTGTLISNVAIAKGVTQEYTMTFTFLETNDNQDDNANATFRGRIQLNNLENTLAKYIMESNLLIKETPDFAIGEPPTNGTNTGSGLYIAQDDDGTSYYLRGAIDNNYVFFAGNTWRIIRINGDGTIRMIIDDDTGTDKAFNSTYAGHKYVGYTYDNDSACTKSSPCISAYDATTKTFTNNKGGTNSTIKDYLENDWYQEIADYDSYIAQGSFCNDTSTINNSSGLIYYGAYQRIDVDNEPSLKCPTTDKTYGGYYISKIGLLSVDELLFAGYSQIMPDRDNNNYLFKNGEFWTMSPDKSSNSFGAVYGGDYGYYYRYLINESYDVRPVINLKRNLVVTSGDGTKANPYKVSLIK